MLMRMFRGMGLTLGAPAGIKNKKMLTRWATAVTPSPASSARMRGASSPGSITRPWWVSGQATMVQLQPSAPTGNERRISANSAHLERHAADHHHHAGGLLAAGGCDAGGHFKVADGVARVHEFSFRS